MTSIRRPLLALSLSVFVSGFFTPGCGKETPSGENASAGKPGGSGVGGGAGNATATGGSGATAGTATMTSGGASSGGVAGASSGVAGASSGVAGASSGVAGASSGVGGASGGVGGASGGVGGSLGGAGGTNVTGGSAGRLGQSGAGATTASGGASVGGATGGGGAGGRAAGGASTAGGAGGAGGSGGGVGAGTLKIIAIGDSTTQSTCWRALLWQTLNTSHAGHFDFVGTHKSDSGCMPSGYDQDNQAYGSSLLTEAVSGSVGSRTCSPNPCPTMSDFTSAFGSTKPDVALIHYGTNDVWNSKSTNDIVAGFTALVDGLRAANANVKVFVAKIIPMNVTDSTCSGCTCSSCGASITALNSAIDSWAPTKSTTASPVAVVDQFTGFNATSDTKDGVHPNDAGSVKMAAKWDAVLEPLF